MARKSPICMSFLRISSGNLPAKIEIKDPLDKLYRGYLKAGIGMYLSPLVDLHYNSERTKYNKWI